jgi:transcription elongation factor GreA
MVKIAKFLLNRKEPRIPFTQAGYDKLAEEKKSLEAKRPEAVEHLKKAREMGDLSENGYYKASRQQLNFIDGRLKRLTKILKRAEIVTSVANGTVQIGSTVKLQSGNQKYEYTIVGGYESNPDQKSISHISPLGSAIFGKRKNDVVKFQAPSGIKIFTITEIS